jgi:hypothetical protein
VHPHIGFSLLVIILGYIQLLLDELALLEGLLGLGSILQLVRIGVEELTLDFSHLGKVYTLVWGSNSWSLGNLVLLLGAMPDELLTLIVPHWMIGCCRIVAFSALKSCLMITICNEAGRLIVAGVNA